MHVLAAVVAFVGFASALVTISSPCKPTGLVVTELRRSLVVRDTPGIPELLTAASSILGWELVGMANNTAQLGVMCDHFNTFGPRLTAVGILAIDVEAPICINRAAALFPTARDIHVKFIEYNTDIFVTQLLNAFDMTITTSTDSGDLNPLAYLCRWALSYRALEALYLDSGRVMEAVCSAGGMPLRPEEEEEHPGLSDTAIADYLKAVTRIFAYEIATLASTVDELHALCSSEPNYAHQISVLNFDPSLVASIICGLSGPLQPSDSINYLIEYTTQVFLILVENMDNTIGGWNSWLCKHLSIDGMNNIGLGGQVAHNAICGS